MFETIQPALFNHAKSLLGFAVFFLLLEFVFPAKNPKGPLKGKYKVMRGGSWINYPVGTRPTDRTDAKPGKRLNFAGFRCVK